MNMPVIFPWLPDKALPRDFLASASEKMRDGGIMVYPTNTLYGLGASIFSVRGVARINEIKSRPTGMPLSIMASVKQMRELCSIPKIADAFISGEDARITAIFPALESAPRHIVHQGTLAIRFPCNNLTASLVEHVGPLTATSANPHGTATPKDIEGAVALFGDFVSIYIDSGKLSGKPTTLIDYTGKRPKIIREGALSAREVEKVHER